jgi:hypothetical protein
MVLSRKERHLLKLLTGGSMTVTPKRSTFNAAAVTRTRCVRLA